MTAAAQSLTVPPAAVMWGVAGEVVQIDHEQRMLWTQCDRVIRAYHCGRCHQHLANRGQLEMHIENTRDSHFVVSYCTRHGYEACEDPRI